jgi:hypothetical protein
MAKQKAVDTTRNTLTDPFVGHDAGLSMISSELNPGGRSYGTTTGPLNHHLCSGVRSENCGSPRVRILNARTIFSARLRARGIGGPPVISEDQRVLGEGNRSVLGQILFLIHFSRLILSRNRLCTRRTQRPIDQMKLRCAATLPVGISFSHGPTVSPWRDFH